MDLSKIYCATTHSKQLTFRDIVWGPIRHHILLWFNKHIKWEVGSICITRDFESDEKNAKKGMGVYYYNEKAVNLIIADGENKVKVKIYYKDGVPGMYSKTVHLIGIGVKTVSGSTHYIHSIKYCLDSIMGEGGLNSIIEQGGAVMETVNNHRVGEWIKFKIHWLGNSLIQNSWNYRVKVEESIWEKLGDCLVLSKFDKASICNAVWVYGDIVVYKTNGYSVSLGQNTSINCRLWERMDCIEEHNLIDCFVGAKGYIKLVYRRRK